MLSEDGLIAEPNGSQDDESEANVHYEQDWEAVTEGEGSLRRDNHLFPSGGLSARGERPKDHQSSASHSHSADKPLEKRQGRWNRPSFGQDKSSTIDEEEALGDYEETESTSAVPVPTEISALLGGNSGNGFGPPVLPVNISAKGGESIENVDGKTTWKQETKVLIKYSMPLIVTFLLQNSLTLTSVFVVGHIGTRELGAVSLGTMTASITGYTVYHGLTTALDTLCAQAYGSGQKKLVGLQLQRMVWCLWVVTIPIAIVWGFSGHIITAIVPEKDIAMMAGKYLQVLVVGAPGYAAFEAGKRYVQAQGLFNITLYVLLICAPLNIFLQWLFVWHFQWGYIGCPIAVSIVELLMPILLLLYVRFVDGMQCWPGFTFKAFRNWGPMIRLAIPGVLMVLAEFLAFEILTLASARISPLHLAANTVLQSLSVLAYQLPWPLSIAASTRVAHYIGAGFPVDAWCTTRVAFVLSAIVGTFNCVLLFSLRMYIPWLFTNDVDVVQLAAATLPVNAAFQLFDAISAICNGLLRSLGRQSFGGYMNLFAYYGVSVTCVTRPLPNFPN